MHTTNTYMRLHMDGNIFFRRGHCHFFSSTMDIELAELKAVDGLLSLSVNWMLQSLS